MYNIQDKRIWSWNIGDLALLSLAVYIATVFVFSSNEQLNIISQAAFVLMCGFSFLYILTQKKALYVNLTVVWLFCLLLLSFCSLSWSIDVSYGIERVVTLIQLVVLCLFANIIIDTPYKVDFSINSVVFSGYVMYIYTFATLGFDGVLAMLADDVRIGGSVNQENAFGYYSAIVFAFALYQMLYKGRKWQVIFLPLPIIMGLLSGSKKSLLLLVVAAFLLIALKERKKVFVRTFFAVAVVMLAAFALYRLGIMDLVLQRFDAALSGTDNSTNKRRLYIEFGIEMFKKKPILGYGIEHFGLLFQEKYGSMHPAHNNYVQILTSFGITGFLLWYGAYFYFLIIGIKNFYKNDIAPMLFFISVITLVNDITTTTLLNKFTYILLAMCFAIAHIIKKGNKEKSIEEHE